jgi:hypothetical protein
MSFGQVWLVEGREMDILLLGFNRRLAPVFNVNLNFRYTMLDRSGVVDSYHGNLYGVVMKTVKLRFDEEGVSIPYPQRSVHITEKG